MTMQDVMIDLETLGSVPGSIILSIGAVPFSAQGAGVEQFYCVINTASCLKSGLASDPDTFDFWMTQPWESRRVLELAKTSELSLDEALLALNAFLARFGRDVRVWGNGADFDNAMLNVAYRRQRLAPGWKYGNNRCYRTLRNLFPQVPFERLGEHHNALDDALSQAAHAAAIMAAMAAHGLENPLSETARKTGAEHDHA